MLAAVSEFFLIRQFFLWKQKRFWEEYQKLGF